MNSTETGTVKFFKTDKGFGFITYGGGDIFVHATGLVSKPINEGDNVEFNIEQGPRGPQATNVVIV